MTAEAKSDKDTEIELTRLRIEYWTKRLDHTLTHTQTSSRLIYLVDGAVLALLAFVINTLGVGRPVVFYLAFPMFALALLNYFHSELIRLQRNWYGNIDKKLRDILGETEVDFPPKKRFEFFSSTHGVYKWIHLVIAGSLFIAAVLMFLYGIGVHLPFTS
jgi:hypothetical protein